MLPSGTGSGDPTVPIQPSEGAPPTAVTEDGDCGCVLAGRSSETRGAFLGLLFGLAALRRRRKACRSHYHPLILASLERPKRPATVEGGDFGYRLE
jgi:hypothetical protein